MVPLFTLNHHKLKGARSFFITNSNSNTKKFFSNMILINSSNIFWFNEAFVDFIPTFHVKNIEICEFLFCLFQLILFRGQYTCRRGVFIRIVKKKKKEMMTKYSANQLTVCLNLVLVIYRLWKHSKYFNDGIQFLRVNSFQGK